MDQREFFDRIAPDWDVNETMSTPERVNKILDFMNIKEGQSVLDLGTGTGVLLPYLAERVCVTGRITAVDYSEGMLGEARKKFGNLIPTPLFENKDIENDTIEGEFDRIILYCVYPHLHEPVETLKWLKRVNLKPKGKIFIAFPCSEEFINNIHKERHSDSDELPSAEKLMSYLCDNGFNAKTVSATDKSYVISIE